MDPVMKVSRHFMLSPERVFIEAAKYCGYFDFPSVGRNWYLAWLIEETLYDTAKKYFRDVIHQCNLK